ncbi:MAG: tetratricopeptide repeat protein [Deltaproteobacteria bacterium]|nr:tetratricopeptide repeat protein [Deltaproteobacteria bacterium]
MAQSMQGKRHDEGPLHPCSGGQSGRRTRDGAGGSRRKTGPEARDMSDTIDRNAVVEINIQMNACRKHLQTHNLYSCIARFGEVLEKLKTTPMLASDSKELHRDINRFQQQLASSRTFRDVYGPVTFRDDDFDTTLDFMRQLMILKDEEVREIMAQGSLNGETSGPGDGKPGMDEARLALERGDFAEARDMVGDDEALRDGLADLYNADGIRSRRGGDFDRAVLQYRKAIAVRPDDEHLHYNLARAYLEKDDGAEARKAIDRALAVNPEFSEGARLKRHIDATLPRPASPPAEGDPKP